MSHLCSILYLFSVVDFLTLAITIYNFQCSICDIKESTQKTCCKLFKHVWTFFLSWKIFELNFYYISATKSDAKELKKWANIKQLMDVKY